MKRPVLFIFMLAAVCSCGPQTTEDAPEDTADTNLVETETTTQVEEETPEEAIDPEEAIPHIIYADNAFGITLGQKIADIKLPVEKTVLETGEGSFDIYEIKLENGTMVGYFHPDIRDEALVGQIVVDFDNAQTEEGVKIGMTFGELKSILDNFEVHGSEIEAKVNVFYKTFAFELDYKSGDYDLDPNEIPDDADIIEIAVLGLRE